MALAALWHQVEQGPGHQGVVDEGIAAAEQPMGLEGEQVGIARTRPHEIHRARQGVA
jgi:hypothetical protein